MKKRADLQGIRGIAISSVLLFHFFPDTFKNGYVGVDQFFILSGFLMAEILSRDASITTSSLYSFYYRRMRRILPLYAIFILFTLFITKMVFPLVFFTYNIPYAMRSLYFISNVQLVKQRRLTYEQMLANAEVLFTHTWSLSCEVQFYIIAPFLIVIPAVLPRKILLCIFAIISYLSFTYLWETDLQELAFNSMFTRIWQFIVGCLCSVTSVSKEVSIEYVPLIMEANDVESKSTLEEKNTYLYSCLSYVNCLSLVTLCLFPIELSPHYVRIIVCLQTAGLIYTGASLPNYFLSNRYIVYLGDISYSLYLIHWPVCVILRQKELNTTLGSLLAILFSILLASLVYEYYEKFYLNLDKTDTFCLCILLYLCCFGFISLFSPLTIHQTRDYINITTVEYPKIPEELDIDTVIGLNTNFSKMDAVLLNIKDCSYDGEPWESICTFDNQNFFGSKRMMFIGNSFAANIARMFIKLEECQEKAKEITMYSRKGCEVLENSGAWDAECKNMTEEFQEAVQLVNPDILFITTRHMTSMYPAKGSVDNILRTEEELLRRIERVIESIKNVDRIDQSVIFTTKRNVNEKVYILNAFPRQISQGFTNSINAGLRDDKRVSQESLLNTRIQYRLARDRMDILAKECTKCELIDIMPVFMKNGTFQFYNEDNGLEYFTDNIHFTYYGLQKISSVYKSVCNSIGQ